MGVEQLSGRVKMVMTDPIFCMALIDEVRKSENKRVMHLAFNSE